MDAIVSTGIPVGMEIVAMNLPTKTTDPCECPAHLPGRQMLSGALQGSLGGAAAGVAALGWVSYGISEPLCPKQAWVFWASLAGMAGATAGLMLGLLRINLAGAGRSVLAASLLLAGSGIVTALILETPENAAAYAWVGALFGVPIGLVGRLMIPRPPLSCSLPSVAEETLVVSNSKENIGADAPLERCGSGPDAGHVATPPMSDGLQPESGFVRSDLRRMRRYLPFAVLWGPAMFAMLKIADIPGELHHSLCGVWGCLPPLQALVAVHLFWLMFLAPAAALANLWLSPKAARWLGILAIGGSFALTAVVVVSDLNVWMGRVPTDLHVYAGRRALFALATHKDLPLVQLAAAGSLCWLLGWRRTFGRRDCSASPPSRRP